MDSIAALERIRTHVRETPLRLAQSLGAATGTRVYLKLENRQDTGAFKLRGAANKLLSLPRAVSARGVVAASTGNHALAVSTIARKLGIPVEIFVSEHIHPHKRAKIEALQARVNAVAGDHLFAELEARRDAERTNRPYVSPYNDPEVIAGQGTVAVEILRQMAEQAAGPLDAVFVAVGGGGLIGGIGTHLKRASPDTQVVGCWPENSPALHECLRAGAIIDVPERPTWSTSTAGGVEPGAITLDNLPARDRPAISWSRKRRSSTPRAGFIAKTANWSKAPLQSRSRLSSSRPMTTRARPSRCSSAAAMPILDLRP